MRKIFIESRSFTDRVRQWIDDQSYAVLQNHLMEHPDSGAVMPGCGGLRKLRIGDPRRQKRKRGGVRLVYLHVPEVNWIYLLDIYGKQEKDDLSKADQKVLRELAAEFKKQALRGASQ